MGNALRLSFHSLTFSSSSLFNIDKLTVNMFMKGFMLVLGIAGFGLVKILKENQLKHQLFFYEYIYFNFWKCY